VTFSGGEPVRQAEALAPLAAAVQARGLTVTVYTGYTWEQLTSAPPPGARALLAHTDLLVDGPFVLAQRSLGLLYRGSRNQRLLDVPASLRAGAPVPWRPKPYCDIGRVAN